VLAESNTLDYSKSFQAIEFLETGMRLL